LHIDYDQTNIPEVYNQGRDHGPAFLDRWMRIIAGHAGHAGIYDILDLGCGTGRFSNGLATHFKANLIGIDPSMKMLQQAVKNRANNSVAYAAGVAEAIPLPAGSVDLIFISMIFHHLTDPTVAAKECGRVLRNHGRLFLRTSCVEKISMYPYVPFFPSSRTLLEQRLPSLQHQRGVFETASFETVAYDVVVQEVAPDYLAYSEKLALKADSIIASLDEQEFKAGLQSLRSHASTTPPHAVTEPIDLLVFRNCRGGL
jgi:ubiquinone/menaquinone biosynthesis C-methylase UbiE